MPLQEIDGILSGMFQKSLKDELKTSLFSIFSWFYVPDWNWFQVANFSIIALCVVYSYYRGIRAVILPSICAFILVEAVQMYFNKLTVRKNQNTILCVLKNVNFGFLLKIWPTFGKSMSCLIHTSIGIKLPFDGLRGQGVPVPFFLDTVNYDLLSIFRAKK